MANAFEVKERVIAETPLLLFDCELANGAAEHWSTHRVECGGATYEARVLRHNVFEMQTASEQGVDGIPRISLTLANADSHFSELERSVGWKGAKVTAKFVFFDLKAGAPASEVAVVFQGMANPPEDVTEATFRLSAVNRMSMQRVQLPAVRIQRRCPWEFPATEGQRTEAIHGGERGRYSRYFRCGYSTGGEGGAGNTDAGAPFTSCGHTRANCEARGMFAADATGIATRSFGGIEFVPSAIGVRSYGEKGTHSSPLLPNEARYNDFVPMVYGTAWYQPPVVFARNDGNLTHLEVLLGMGEIQGIVKVVVNDIELAQGQAGTNMTATGWYSLVSDGNRTGNFNADFPSGDPYGSMAYLSVVVPNRISDGRSLPDVKVLIQGLKLASYDQAGTYTGDEFTNNPAWILLDVLQRSGWRPGEIDLASFARAAAYCGESIYVNDVYGNPISVQRFQCNLVAQKRRSAADLIRGIRNAARMLLTYGASGQLQLRVENTLAVEQPSKPDWSNSALPLDGGWPNYEFGDGSGGSSGIARRSNGEPSVRVWSRSMADTPNRFAVEFQDAFNEYQQDSFSLVDVGDVARTGQEITATLAALGIANYDQAARVLKFHLDKSVYGNTYVEFETSVKGLGLRPGDLIALTYLKEGFTRQAFRVLKIAPGMNYRLVTLTAQLHRDEWYSDVNGEGATGGRRQAGAGVGIPRPLAGSVLDEDGELQYDITESTVERSDGTISVQVSVGFEAPQAPQGDAPGIPLVSLAARIGDGGALAAGQTWYYAVSAVDSAGRESALSFIVPATIPEGENGKSVRLGGLSFASGTTTFRVYRGMNPAQLHRIATDQAPATEFMDPGSAMQPPSPPDPNYDHANFYWRPELQPELAATLHSANTVGNETLQMEENECRGAVARITRGRGSGQERGIIGNTATVLTLGSNWTIEPNTTSRFVVAEGAWRFGAVAKRSPVQFEIPNQTGAVVEMSGRSANANDVEAPEELCTMTRWTVGGGGHSDADVPPVPVFSLALSMRRAGRLELSGVSFEDLTNTRTVTAGTLTVYYWNELASPTGYTLPGPITADETTIPLTVAGTAAVGSYLQIEREILRIVEVADGVCHVTRGAHGSTAAAHAAPTAVYHLDKQVVVAPFPRDFFGSPASGNWSYGIELPNVRVASAELFVTNAKGNGSVGAGCLTQNTDSGLRTMAGGQFSFQVDGYLAVDNAATADVIVDRARSVRDAFAVVKDAPQGAPITLRLKRNGAAYCDLTIGDGATISNVMDGIGLAPLASGDRLGLEVLGVGGTLPGSDLTVVVRL